MTLNNLLLLAALVSGSSVAASATPPAAPVLTLKAARALGAGSTVTVRAVVLNGAEMGNIRYVQDGEAGLALYAQPTKLPGYGELRAGDSIQVTGQLKVYNGLLEMDPVASFHKIAGGLRLHAIPVPMAQVSTAFIEANESRLLDIKGVSRLATPTGPPATAFSGNANYLLDGQAGALMRVGAASTGPDGLVNATPPTAGSFDIRGILSQFAPGGTGGYQLLPRLASDLVLGGGLPRLTEEPVPVDVNPTGFTIVYSTLNPGDTRVRYGLTAKELKESRVDAALTTRHSLTLTDLLPGTTYYVEVSSRNAAGTETAAPVPFITGSGKRARVGAKN
ncbi:fibronectin type III domain-containing protein [Hymenobacter sp. BT770]|uniref:fibronectin type III domain-containing protein n=1 Tax=Hymenobacter sp. BT770 TaxID=2886942 RepID=UPI001D10CB18|nr:fibronectin type III domain-containing protein [Hymenobacter sp. BT770]MCC3152112.1 fibronectin type III domain-containing protein [Hymenobacter sp. BT770]MDO3415205.1 fibronectin type III domain-containing protein [Hymenobacter sp. BT770]